MYKSIFSNNFFITRVLWSRPIPLGWYFAPQWERIHGRRWPQTMCNNWLRNDRFLKNYAAQVWVCPCTLEHALLDKGRFMPDLHCDRDINPTCRYHWGALHCVRSGAPRYEISPINLVEFLPVYSSHLLLQISQSNDFGP